MNQAAKPNFVTALARGLAVLRCFDRPRLELTVSQIARRVGLSQPTTWRLCQTLLDCGYLVRGSGSTLRVGAPALTLGYAAVAGMAPAELALPYMREISETHEVTTTLCQRIGSEIVAIEQVDGIFVRPDQPIGWRAPLPSTATGIAILAALSPAARTAAMDSVSGDTDAMRRRQDRVERGCVQYAHDGFVTVRHDRRGGYVAIAVPLFEDGTDPEDQWSLTCGFPMEQWNKQRVAETGEALIRTRELLQPALAAMAAQKFAPSGVAGRSESGARRRRAVQAQ